MNYILFVSNKDNTTPFLLELWDSVIRELNVDEKLMSFRLGKSLLHNDKHNQEENCKAIVVYWMGDKEDKEVQGVLKLAKGKHIPVIGQFTSNCLPVFENLDKSKAEVIIKYLLLGGRSNFYNLYRYLLHSFLDFDLSYEAPLEQPWNGIYLPNLQRTVTKEEYYKNYYNASLPTVAINFPRDHLIWGQTEYVRLLTEQLHALECNVLCLFSHWNRDRLNNIPAFEINFKSFAVLEGKLIPDALINCLWFSLTMGRDNDDLELLKKLNLPILQGQIILQEVEQWKVSLKGLKDSELNANIIMPEFDGVIHGVPIAGRQKQAGSVKVLPIPHNIKLLARMACNWAKLRCKCNGNKRIALIFHNYPAGNATIGTAMGLDSLRSGEVLLQALAEAGYNTGKLPEEKGWLAKHLLSGFTNEVEYCKRAAEPAGVYPVSQYSAWFEQQLEKVKKHLNNSWGNCPGEEFIEESGKCFKIPGFRLNNIFVSVQPPRIALGDITRTYHDSNIPPTHYYLAYYKWLVETFQADAVIHLGTHGTLEWLPGKGAGLSNDSYPYLAIDALPNIYPYLISITCEGLQAKRRAAAVLIDHLPAPAEEAELYGELLELNNLLEQYIEAEKNDNETLPYLEKLILDKVNNSQQELVEKIQEEKEFLPQVLRLHNYLESLGNRSCRIGLHVLGEIPQGRELDSFVKNCSQGKVELHSEILEKLEGTTREITNILEALRGNYIEAGLSGAPTTGMLDCLPSGKNFYGVDPRVLPSHAAYLMGKALADKVIEHYIKDEGKYPERIGMVLWSGTNMRTKGCDIAQAMALMGVQPEWKANGRIEGFKIIPLETLQRPRIDVMFRISGMYRDSLYPTVELLDECVKQVMALEEATEQNYLKKHVQEDEASLSNLDKELIKTRIFGSALGTYGAGVNLALENSNWNCLDDLKDIFVNWGGYAYGKKEQGIFSPEVFSHQLSKIDVTVKNEDHYEVNMLGSDDYNSFHGGLIAAVRSLSGKRPRSYCGDLSRRDKVEVRTLAEEMKQLYVSEVLNPKFIEGMMKHGYKGAADLCSVVSHSFQWDATSDIVEDWMYNELVEKYIRAAQVNSWLREVNPWALQKMCVTLLEAKQRGLWNAPKELEQLLVGEMLDIEGELEERNDD